MSKTTLTLPEKFDISIISGLKGRFQKALEKEADTIEMNADAVMHMDSSAIQLILSFQKAAAGQSKEVKIIKASEGFETAAELLGAHSLVNEV